MIYKVLLFILFLIEFTSVKSQDFEDNQKDSLINLQLNSINSLVDTLIYNSESYLIGKLYYLHGTIENNPFYPDYEWKPGYVEIGDGSRFQISMMKYDIENDAPVVLRVIDNQGYAIQLDKNRITKFNIEGHNFEYLDNAEGPGYYEIIYKSPQISVIAKRTIWKKIDALSNLKVPLYMKDLHCFICQNNECNKVDNIKDVFRLFNEQKQDLKIFRKANKLSFRKDRINTLLKLTQQYDRAGAK
jgi:hypothetical protein